MPTFTPQAIHSYKRRRPHKLRADACATCRFVDFFPQTLYLYTITFVTL